MPAPARNAAVAADSTGLPDSLWISQVRDALEDYPEYVADTQVADGVNGVVAANATPFKTSRRPIADESITVRDNTAGTNFTVITSGTPTSTQVLVNYNNGELRFLNAPANANSLQYSYQYVKWRDQKILDALDAGLRAMFPKVGKTYTDTSIKIQVNKWDYTLPVWLQDPRSRIFNLEIQDPGISIQPFTQVAGGFHRVDLNTIHIPRAQRYSPVAFLRIVGWGPYIQLADLEPQLFHLPVWYALSVLLPKKESYRVRQDTMVPLTQEGGQSPGVLVQTGDYYLKRFETELERLGRVPSPGFNVRVRTVYEYDRHF
jgi:hypothetical protein